MHVEVTIIYLNNIAPIFYYDIKSHGVQLILIGLFYEKHSHLNPSSLNYQIIIKKSINYHLFVTFTVPSMFGSFIFATPISLP